MTSELLNLKSRIEPHASELKAIVDTESFSPVIRHAANLQLTTLQWILKEIQSIRSNMKVTEIVVAAGRTFNHPHENYSNLRPSITVKATLDEGDDFEQVIKDLQAKAEQLVEDHKRHMLSSLEEIHDLSERQQEMASLARSISRAQSRIDAIRKENPQITLLPAGEVDPTGEVDFEEQEDYRKGSLRREPGW